MIFVINVINISFKSAQILEVLILNSYNLI